MGHILPIPRQKVRSGATRAAKEGPHARHRQPLSRRRVSRPRGRQAQHRGGLRGVLHRRRARRREGRRRPARPLSLHQPRAQHARFLRARRGRGARRQQPAARAREVRRHPRLHPRRVLHGPHRRSAPAGRRRRRGGLGGRVHPAEAPAAGPGARLEPHEGGARLLQRAAPGARRRRHPHRRLRYARRRPEGGSRRILCRAGLPGAHAARLRPRAALPAHLQHEPQPRRAGARPERGEALRPRQGAGRAAAPPGARARA